tara:strand:- start:159 stop:446 length:288 start_codon:yes stop_codon:yes gene_type:complete
MIHKIVNKALIELGQTEKDFDFKTAEENKCTLRYGYWRTMPDELHVNLIEKLSMMDIVHDVYVDDDGETEDGRTIHRYLHSYEIKFKDGKLETTN